MERARRTGEKLMLYLQKGDRFFTYTSKYYSPRGAYS